MRATVGMGVTVKFHKNSWWIFINHNGRRRAKKVGDRVTALDVARKIRQEIVESDFSLSKTDQGPLLRAYATKWLDDGKTVLKWSTQRFYKGHLENHILPTLGDRSVKSLKRADCRDLVTACHSKKLSSASIKAVNRTLSAVLSLAVEDELLPANPAFRMGKHMRTGDDLPNEINPLTAQEAHDMLVKAEEAFPEFHPFFLCAVRTGLRLGELLGLQWADLDFNQRFIHVRRTRTASRISSTKNKKNRRVDMSVKLVDVLRSLRTKRKRDALKAGTPMNPWVFLTPDGNPVDGDNLRSRVFGQLLKAAGVRRVRLHDLRHTYASLLIRNNESLVYIQRQMGHSSISVTVDNYGHLIPGENRGAVDRLDAVPTCNPGATDDDLAAVADGRN